MELIQDILPLVEKPSQYLGTEVNAVKKNLDLVDLKVSLAFPDLYEIGTSHFGLQILYHILNKYNNIAAERVFAPGTDMEEYLRSNNIPLGSLESETPLRKFDILGFSLLYELNYTNILTILELAQIPFFASKRDGSFPVIIAGGPCMCNPEPVADFFDAIVIGDGEYVIQKMTNIWLELNRSGGVEKDILLQRWSEIEGVYIPSFFKVSFDNTGFQTLTPFHETYTRATRTIVPDLDSCPFPETPIVPFGRPIHDRLRLEVARGCTRGCRFCQAGMIYRPVRERPMETLLSIAEKSIPTTGHEDISLLSLSTGDYSCLTPLMQQLMDRYSKEHIAVSLPSVRAGSLTPELMNLIKKVRKTGFTIAPEAGSQRLRDIINKNITDTEVVETVKHAFDLGWNIIKLYFMIGLPFETKEDLVGIVDMVNNLKELKAPKGRQKKINVSVTTFIPKAHVPFQWASQISLAESQEKIGWLKKQLKIPGVSFKYQQPEVSLLEGLFARGGRRLGRLLVTAYNKGCRFDGWSDKFNFKKWQEAFEEADIDTDFYIGRTRNIHEPLPWDHINMGISREFFKKEWRLAEKKETTADCRNHECNTCGVCDFKTIQPVIAHGQSGMPRQSNQNEPNNNSFLSYQVTWSKKGQAKFFGHLELVNIFFKAIKRARIPVRFSEGFHPKPRISFADPLPLGIESLEEHFILSVQAGIEPGYILKGLNNHLPTGLNVEGCKIVSSKYRKKDVTSTAYDVVLKEGMFDENRLKDFNNTSEVILSRRNRKGKLKKINLKDMIGKLDLIASDHMKVELNHEPGKTIRPKDILTMVFGLNEDAAKQAIVVKTYDI